MLSVETMLDCNTVPYHCIARHIDFRSGIARLIDFLSYIHMPFLPFLARSCPQCTCVLKKERGFYRRSIAKKEEGRDSLGSQRTHC
jgi:hypothetical protein